MHRILVIGTGSIGERHARCLLHTGRAQVGICEINTELRARVAERYGIAEAFADLDEALTREWAAAVIATPAHTHIPIALRLAQAGIHLLIEKPLSTTTDGVSRLIETVRERELVAVVAYVLRAHPALAEMRRELLSGRFGAPLEVVSVGGQHFPFHRPAYREIYYRDRKTGGGAIQDALPHILNAAEWLVGPIDRVLADAEHLRLEDVTVEDTVHLLSRHGQVMGSFSLNQHQAANENMFTVVCEGGILRFELLQHRWRWQTDPADTWHDEARPPLERDDLFTMQENAFLDTLERKAEPLCTLEEGLQTLKVCLAALKSADSGPGFLAVGAS